MNKKSLNFIIDLVVYPFQVMVSISESDESLFAKLKKVGVDISDTNLHVYSDTQRGRCIMFKENQTLIRMYELRDTPAWYGHLAHEIFHAVEFLMDRIGMKLTNESDEAYAYLISYLTEEIYKKLK
jgi:hypothetical protein